MKIKTETRMTTKTETNIIKEAMDKIDMTISDLQAELYNRKVRASNQAINNWTKGESTPVAKYILPLSKILKISPTAILEYYTDKEAK